MMRKPDFIIIGAMKCATSTLSAQLEAQPGIFCTTPKEPNFFSDDDVYARGLDWYLDLFSSAAPGDLLGEASTHYTKLPTHPRALERMREVLTAPKLVYVMRHPVDRLVSHFMHGWRDGRMGGDINDAVGKYEELVAYSRYAMQLEPYFRAYGPDNVLPVFSGCLRKAPQAELERVCRFIGYAGAPVWSEETGDQNTASEQMRKSPLRDAVVNAPGISFIRRTFVPKQTREWVKQFWKLREKPQLSSETRQFLETTFDDDLRMLAEWLGIDTLTCANFGETVDALEDPVWRTELVPRC